MSLPSSKRRKDFRDKEISERLNVSEAVKQEFIGDLTRLLEEGYHGDITFIVGKEEFLAHAAILKARAPRFCDQFLPRHLNPSNVEVCIHLQGLTSDDFRQFLRSVYTDNVAPDHELAKNTWTHEVVCSPPTKLIHESNKDSCDGGAGVVIHDEYSQQVDKQNSSGSAAVSAAGVKETQQERDQHTSSTSLLSGDCSQNGQKDEDDVFLVAERNNKLLDELKSYCCCPVGEDLVHLIDAEEGSDVVFVINDRKIRAHRAILCCRSRYFSAMLSGTWLEGSSKEIRLHDLSYDGFLTVLCYMYGGTARVPTNLAYISGELLPLADMYGLTALKDVICSELKIEKCHLFHEPCDVCITSVLDCLRISHLFVAFGCIEFKNSCIRWVVRHFDRMCCTKGFAQLNQSLHDEILAEIQNGFRVSSTMDLLKKCHRFTACTPRVKWAEPVHVFLSALQDICILFSVQTFPALVSDRSFLDVLKGVGWSTSLIECVVEAVNSNMCIETCCDQLRAVLWLQHTIAQTLDGEVDKESAATSIYPEESIVLVERLHLQCKAYITSNLHKVRRTGAWNALSPKTQNDLREGAVIDFVDDGAGALSARSKPFPGNMFESFRGSSPVNRQTGAPRGSQARATISAQAGQRRHLSEANSSKRCKTSQVTAARTPKGRACPVNKGTSLQRARRQPSSSSVSKGRGGPSTGNVQNNGPRLEGSSQNIKGLVPLGGRPSDAPAKSGRQRPSTGEVQGLHLEGSSRGVLQKKGPLETATVGDRKGRPSDAGATSGAVRSLRSQSPNNRSSATGEPLSAKSLGRTARAPLQKPGQGATHKDQDKLQQRKPAGVQSSVRREKSAEQRAASAPNLSKDKGKQRPGKLSSTASVSSRPAWQRPSNVPSVVACKNSVKKKQETSLRASSSARPAWQSTSSVPRVTCKNSNTQQQGMLSHAPSSAGVVRQRPLIPSVSHTNVDKQKQDELSTVSNSATPTSRSPSTVQSLSADPSSAGPVEQVPLAVPSSNGNDNNKQQEGEKLSIALSSSGSTWVAPSNVPSETGTKNSSKKQQTKLPNASDPAEGTWQRPSSAPNLLCKDTKRQQGKQSTAPSSGRPTKQRPYSAPSVTIKATSKVKDSLEEGSPSGYLKGSSTVCDGRQPTAATSSATRSRSHLHSPSEDQNRNAGNEQVNGTSKRATVLSTGDLVEASELPDVHRTQENDPSRQAKHEAVGCAQALQSCSSNVTKKVGPLCSEGSSGETAVSTGKADKPDISTRPKEITFVISRPSEAKRHEDNPEIPPDARVSAAEDTKNGASDRVRNITYVVKAAPKSEDANKAVSQERGNQAGATSNRDTNSANAEKPECSRTSGVTEADSDNKSEVRSEFDDVVCAGTSVEGKVQAAKCETTGFEGGRVTDSGNESGSQNVAGHVQEEPPSRAAVDLPGARKTQETDVNTAKNGTPWLAGSFPAGIVQTPRFVRGDSGACCLDWMPRGNSTPCSEKSARRPLNFSTKQKCLFNADETFDLSFGNADISNDGITELENSVRKKS